MSTPQTALRPTAVAPSPSRRSSWDHPQSAWVCETAELLAGFGAPAGEASHRLLWGAAGLPNGRPCVRSRSGHRGRGRADALNGEALAALGEACAAEARLLDDGSGTRSEVAGRLQAAVDLIDDALAALREALDLVS